MVLVVGAARRRPQDSRGTSTHPDPAGRRAGTTEVRADIQGLRAIAVLLVVAFHLWPSRLTGGYVGVDVFFVISGFLITAHLVGRPPASGRDLAGFWARRIRRLLPASLLVLAVTLGASRLIAPGLTWAATARETAAAALYVENWALATSAVDYLAADAEPTPVQHFWSLSVEEQFYLVWPVLVAVLVWLATRRFFRQATRRRIPTRAVLAVGMGAVFVGSLAYSVLLTASDPARAYFVTPTRAWEFAAGGLVAVLAPGGAARLGDRARTTLAWAGLAAIVVAGVTFTVATPFPGSAALLPVLGTAVVIAARAESRSSPAALWRRPGVRWTGDASYSIYLWHWPLVVLVPNLGSGGFGVLDAALVVVATVLLAGLTKRYVEDRFRFPQGSVSLASAYRLAVVGMTVVVALALVQHREATSREDAARDRLAVALARGAPCFGAVAIVAGPADCPVDPDAPVVPDLALAAQDRSDAYPDDCFTGAPYDGRRTCTYGDGPTKVALVGNSHAGQWLPALQRIADQRGWTITTYLISYCNVTGARLALPDPEQSDNCIDYGRWVLEQTKASAYDLVITSERQSALVEGRDWVGTQRAAQAAYRDYLRHWADSGARVVVLQDQVVPDRSVGRVPECLAAADGDVDVCSWRQDQPIPSDPDVYRWMDPLDAAARELDDPRVGRVQTQDLLCSDGTCRPVVGTVVTFFDASHVTATYAATMAPYLDERIRRATG